MHGEETERTKKQQKMRKVRKNQGNSQEQNPESWEIGTWGEYKSKRENKKRRNGTTHVWIPKRKGANGVMK